MTLDDPAVSLDALSRSVNTVCVIGAGTMGAGIAAHLHNLGFSVTLLDSSQQAVLDGLNRAKQAHPPAFFIPDRAGEIRLGNTLDHLEWAAECDWVCEAIIEKAEAKKHLYHRLDSVLGSSTFVTTNTSGLEIKMLAEDRSDRFRHKFVGAHFFNPPRYLKLLELIPTDETDRRHFEQLRKFFEDRVGRRVVVAKDTPGFIANRFGMWSIFHAVHTAEKLQLRVEQVDAITGKFLGRPSSATFRLCDIVGIDIMRDIAANLLARCPDDPYISALNSPDSLHGLLARHWIGQKTGQGFYRQESSEYLALEMTTFAYRPQREADLPSLLLLRDLPLGRRIAEALKLRDEVGEYLRLYLLPCLRYADWLKDKVSHSVEEFDRVMEWGFGWEMGPFRLLDAIGHEPFGIDPEPFYKTSKQRSFAGKYVALPKEPEFAPLSSYKIVGKGKNFVLRDLGEAVTAVCTTTKLGVVTPELVDELISLFESTKINRFVLTSESPSFSVGYDLNVFQSAITTHEFGRIQQALLHLSRLGALLERRQGVAALKGYALGGGFELALSCPHIVADAETKIGLPEAKVGLIPGGRGLALTRAYNQFTARRLCDVAESVIAGEISNNAEHARHLGYLRPTDVTSFHPDRLIFTARELALKAVPVVHPSWTLLEGPLAGMIDRMIEQNRHTGRFTEYDAALGQEVKQIYVRSGGFDEAVERERERFMALCHNPFTQARIRYMIEHNRPLRN